MDNYLKISRCYSIMKNTILNKNLRLLRFINFSYNEIFFKEKCKIIEYIRYERCHIYKPIFYKFIKEDNKNE